MIIHAPKVNGPNPDKQPSCRLFQLSDPALLKIFENQFNKSNGDITPAIPKPLVFKGSPDDEVILCTEDVTFQVRDVHTSNNFMLLAPLKNIDNSYRVIHQSSTYLETLRFPGHLESLRLRLLNSIPYYPHLDTSEPHINSNDFPINFESNSSSPHVMPSGKGSKDFQDDMLLEENILDSVQVSFIWTFKIFSSIKLG